MDKEKVKKETFRFLSKDGKTKIHAIKWMPGNGRVRAVMQLSHGMVEYIERYDEFACYLASRGFLVVGHDHLGHGESVIDESEWGYFTQKNPSETVVADIYQVTRIIRSQYPDCPYFIFGHSMGSYLVRKYLTLYSEEVDGAILCGTGRVSSAACRLGMAVCGLLALFRGWHFRSGFVKKSAFGGAYARFCMDGSDPENSWLSTNVESVKKFYADPLCGFDFTLNGYYGLMSTVLYDNQEKYIRNIRRELPIFLISGSEDPVGAAGVGVKRVYQQYIRAGLKNVTMKLYKGDRHELINETDRADVYADVWEWIKHTG